MSGILRAPRLTRSMKMGKGKPIMPFDASYELAVATVETEQDRGYNPSTEQHGADLFYQKDVKFLMETQGMYLSDAAIALGKAQEISYIATEYQVSAPIAIRAHQMITAVLGKSHLIGSASLSSVDLSHIIDIAEAEFEGRNRMLPEHAPIMGDKPFRILNASDLSMEERLDYENLANGYHPESALKAHEFENIQGYIEDAGAQDGLLH